MHYFCFSCSHAWRELKKRNSIFRICHQHWNHSDLLRSSDWRRKNGGCGSRISLVCGMGSKHWIGHAGPHSVSKVQQRCDSKILPIVWRIQLPDRGPAYSSSKKRAESSSRYSRSAAIDILL